MTIKQIIDLLKNYEPFLKAAEYGYIEILSEKLGSCIVFTEEDQLDKFANSKPDETEHIVLKAFGNKKTLFIAVKEYDVILIYDESSFSLSQFWKKENKEIKTKPIHLEKFKAEILNHFSNVKNQKLVS